MGEGIAEIVRSGDVERVVHLALADGVSTSDDLGQGSGEQVRVVVGD